VREWVLCMCSTFEAAGERACGRLGEGLAGTQAEEAVDMHVRTTDRESRSRKSKTESFL